MFEVPHKQNKTAGHSVHSAEALLCLLLRCKITHFSIIFFFNNYSVLTEWFCKILNRKKAPNVHSFKYALFSAPPAQPFPFGVFSAVATRQFVCREWLPLTDTKCRQRPVPRSWVTCRAQGAWTNHIWSLSSKDQIQKKRATTHVYVCALVPAIRESLELTAGEQIYPLREAESPAEIIAHVPGAG